MHIQTNMTALPPVNAPNDVFALAIRDEGLYAGFNGGVAFFDGQTWTPRVNGLHVASVCALANAGKWLIAGGLGGIARSDDGGKHWQPAQAAPFDIVVMLAVSPHFEQDQALIAITNKALFRSDDAGLTWADANFGLVNGVEDLIWDENTLLALSWTHIYRSPNGGLAWKSVKEVDEDEGFAGMTRLSDGSLFAITVTNWGFRSDDQGATWAWVENDGGYSDKPFFFNGAIPKRNFAIPYLNEKGFHLTADNGKTWKPVDDVEIQVLTVKDNQRAYAMVKDRLATSEGDFANWVALPELPVLNVRRILLFKGDLFAYRAEPTSRLTGVREVLNWREDVWKRIGYAPIYFTAVTRYQDRLYASDGWKLIQSTDGKTWDEARLEDVIKLNRFELSHLAFLSDQVIYASGWDGSFLARTTDGGKTWQTTPSPFGILPVLTLHANQHLIFAATFDPRRKMIALWRSMDGGQKWYPGAEVPSEWGIAAGFSDPAMIALPGIVLVSGADPNAAWTRAAFDKDGSPLTNIQVRMITGDEKIQFALTLVDGIYVSRDRGMHWSHLALELPEDQLMDISYDPDTEHLAVLSVGAHVHLIELNLEE